VTQHRFFQISLFFPFVLWCLFLLVSSLVYKQGMEFLLDNLYNAYRVMLPYSIFAAITWKKADNKPYRMLNIMALVIPFIWGTFFTLFFIVMTFIRTWTIESWFVLFSMTIWAVGVAYLVELVPYIILTIFKDDFKSVSCQQVDKVSMEQCRTSQKG
jgi:hypothetical protein